MYCKPTLTINCMEFTKDNWFEICQALPEKWEKIVVCSTCMHQPCMPLIIIKVLISLYGISTWVLKMKLTNRMQIGISF